jgi:hypothetical protein
MTLGQDWPMEEVQDVLQAYGFRILGRERHRSKSTPWQKKPGRKHQTDDAEAAWTQTHYTIRRDLVCESCSQAFGYIFEVDQLSQVYEGRRRTDGTLRQQLSHQVRRRIRCPHCRSLQKEPRRTLLRQSHWITVQGCGVAGAGLLLTSGLALLGGWQAGILGFLVGLAIGLVGVIALWFSVLPRIFAKTPPV